MTDSKITKDTPVDLIYQSYLEATERESKLKQHLAVALNAQKISQKQYEHEKEGREKIEAMFKDLSKKCDLVREENISERNDMLNSMKGHSEKINEQIELVTKENENLLEENEKHRKRIIALLEQKEKFIKDAGTWRDISTEMRKEMARLREENATLNSEMAKSTKNQIEDKKLIQKSILQEKELRKLLEERSNEFSIMYEKSMAQSKYIVGVAADMKKMTKEVDKLRKKLHEAEADKLKSERGVLMIAKEKLEGDAALAKKDVKIATLEKLCRALQAKQAVANLKEVGKDAKELKEKFQQLKAEDEKQNGDNEENDEKSKENEEAAPTVEQ